MTGEYLVGSCRPILLEVEDEAVAALLARLDRKVERAECVEQAAFGPLKHFPSGHVRGLREIGNDVVEPATHAERRWVGHGNGPVAYAIIASVGAEPVARFVRAACQGDEVRRVVAR